MIKRIGYISRFARTLSRAEVERLAEDATKRNQELGITGMLMTSGGIFYQIIEGPPEAIDDLYQRIAADTRHTNMLLLSVDESDEGRFFPGWSMKKIDLEDDASGRMEPIKALMQVLVGHRELMQQMMQVLSRTIWQELMGAD